MNPTERLARIEAEMRRIDGYLAWNEGSGGLSSARDRWDALFWEARAIRETEG